jgi:DNA-binding beta-propeller fold protein YncE
MRKIVLIAGLLSVVSLANAQRPANAAPAGAARLSTVAMIDLPGRPGFDDTAIANNLIVTSHTGANAIDVFDPQRRRLVAQISNIAQPRGIAVDAKNNRFYVATANSVIAVVSSQDWQVKDSFNVQGSPDVLALSADGMRLYIGDKTDSTISAVDTSLRKTIGNVELTGRPEAIAIGDSRMIYVSVQDQAMVVGIDPQMNVVAQFKLQASQPTGLVYDPAGRRLYVAVRSAVLAINADNGSEVGRAPATRGVSTLYLDQSTHTLFAAGGGSLLSFNTAGNLSAQDELLADVKGHAFTYDTERKLIFMPGGREGRSKMLIVRDLSAGGPPQPAPAEAKLQ